MLYGMGDGWAADCGVGGFEVVRGGGWRLLALLRWRLRVMRFERSSCIMLSDSEAERPHCRPTHQRVRERRRKANVPFRNAGSLQNPPSHLTSRFRKRNADNDETLRQTLNPSLNRTKRLVGSPRERQKSRMF
jgi:hypothetical protein